jgi:methionyl-tRNA formyltransferase
MTLLPGVLFLAAHTARSQAYAQAMIARGFRPEHVLLFGVANQGRPGQGQAENHSAVPNLLLPNLSIPLADSVQSAGWNVSQLAEGDVNSPAIAAAIREIAPRMVIYSGYGGQILREEVLSLSRFLHLHAGWLPEERGSTTSYYGLIRHQRSGVSAIFLASEIDQGPILARKEYPCPPAGTDLDYHFDSAIRADLLVDVLARWSAGEELRPLDQDPSEGTTYYVMHPVLKHLVSLTLP